MSERIEAARDSLVMLLADQMDAARWLPDGERAGREAESWPVLTAFESAVRAEYAPLVAAARATIQSHDDYITGDGSEARHNAADEALRAALEQVEGDRR